MPDTDAGIFYPEWQASFRRELACLGFGPIIGDKITGNEQDEAWDGDLWIHWNPPDSSEVSSAHHRVQIVLRPEFPFRPPRVIPLDTDPPIRDSRHQEPGDDNGALCLWPDDAPGWTPETTASQLLDRVRAWFVHYRLDDWPLVDRPPDMHLYFPARTIRPLMLIADDWKPPQTAMAGRFGVWQSNARRAFAGVPVADGDIPAGKHSDRILTYIGMADRSRNAVGAWFRLGREPRPRPTLGAFLAEIDEAMGVASGFALARLRTLYGNKLAENIDILLAVGYPSPGASDPAQQWLFLKATLPKGEKRRNWTSCHILSQMRLDSFETAPAGWEALMRRTRHALGATVGSKALIFGVGAIGSCVTLLLAKSGMTAIDIVDSGYLRPGNSVRHAAGLNYVGYPKTVATKLEAQSHAPDCEITCRDASWSVEKLADWIWEADVVIDATANLCFSLLLNELCLREGRPALYATAHRRATVGRIRVVRPGRDACLVCYRKYADADDLLFIPPIDEGEFVEAGCGVPTVEASAADVEAVANMAARTAIWLLDNKLQEDNHCFVVNDPVSDASTLLSRVGVNWSCWPPVSLCEACDRNLS